MSAKNSHLSVVVPCYNEEQVIRSTHRSLVQVMSVLTHEFELIYVNDGSHDRTLEVLKEINQEDGRAKVVNLSRNFGHQVAVTAGLDQAVGDAVIIIDADLQDPPEVICAMVDKWREGFKVVYGKRVSREGETRFKLLTAKWFYKILNHLSEVEIPKNVGDFRLIDRQVADALREMPERFRFLRGMVSWAGFSQFALEYERKPRAAGETKYPFKKMIRFASDGILSFSTAPLRAAIWIGIFALCAAIAGIVYALVLRLFTNQWVEGFTLILVSTLFLGGTQILFLGIIGEYIGRIFTESKSRPLYFVSDYIGFNMDGAVRPDSKRT